MGYRFQSKLRGFHSNIHPGIAMPGSTPSMEKFDCVKGINVNFYGCVHVVKHFVSTMVERKDGLVIINSSGCGLMGGHYNSLYVTSKHELNRLK